jgi:hypothetical protein
MTKLPVINDADWTSDGIIITNSQRHPCLNEISRGKSRLKGICIVVIAMEKILGKKLLPLPLPAEVEDDGHENDHKDD